jgi:pimeloyl-ACP methyl ester carboxylesterase
MPVACVNDVDLHYEISGVGTPVVLVHGVGARLDNWEGVAARLAAHFQVIRFDLRGHGRSSKVPGPYTLDLFTADLVGLMDHLGLPPCRVAGHSLGGLIAQNLAVRHPERVMALALLSTACGRSPEEKAKVLARVDLIANGISGDHFRNSVARWFTDAFRDANPDVIARYAARNA